MAEHLSVFHHDFRLHEQPGSGHWWDEDDEPGAACVDWAPMFDFFSRRVIPAKDMVRDVTFVTVNPRCFRLVTLGLASFLRLSHETQRSQSAVGYLETPFFRNDK